MLATILSCVASSSVTPIKPGNSGWKIFWICSAVGIRIAPSPRASLTSPCRALRARGGAGEGGEKGGEEKEKLQITLARRWFFFLPLTQPLPPFKKRRGRGNYARA